MRKYFFLGLVFFVLPQFAAAEIVAQCAEPQGLSDYMRGEIVSSNEFDVSAGGGLTLVRDATGFDLLFRANDGTLRSVRRLGGAVEGQVSGNGSRYHLRVGQAGHLDHFLFRAEGPDAGKIVWASQRIEAGKTVMRSAACSAS